MSKPGEKTLAGGYITISDLIKTTFKLIKTKNGGYFVAFPSYQSADGEWKPHVDTVSKEAREKITEAILKEYSRQTDTNTGNGNKRVETESKVPSGVPF